MHAKNRCLIFFAVVGAGGTIDDFFGGVIVESDKDIGDLPNGQIEIAGSFLNLVVLFTKTEFIQCMFLELCLR